MDDAILELAGLRVTSVGDPAAPLVVVLLHGRQMEPADLSPFARSIGVPAWFLFPEGPLAAAPRGRAWWPMVERGGEGPRDLAAYTSPDLPAARARLGALLDELAPRVGARPLVVGGFSQGGMLVVDTLLRAPRPVAAIALLSASRIASADWPALLARAPLAGVPALVSHGRADDDLAFAAGEALRDAVAAAGAAVTWVPFDGGHEIPLVVWRALRRLLAALG